MVGLHTSWVLIIILTKQIYWEWSRLKVIYFLFLFCEASFRSGKAAEIGAVAMWINKPSRVKFFAVSMFVTFGKDEWRVLIFVVIFVVLIFVLQNSVCLIEHVIITNFFDQWDWALICKLQQEFAELLGESSSFSNNFSWFIIDIIFI